jgi:hypothetical protein
MKKAGKQKLLVTTKPLPMEWFGKLKKSGVSNSRFSTNIITSPKGADILCKTKLSRFKPEPVDELLVQRVAKDLGGFVTFAKGKSTRIHFKFPVISSDIGILIFITSPRKEVKSKQDLLDLIETTLEKQHTYGTEVAVCGYICEKIVV